MSLAMDTAAKDIAGAATYLADRPRSAAQGSAPSASAWAAPSHSGPATLHRQVVAVAGFYPAVPWDRMSPSWSNYEGKDVVIHCSEEDGTSSRGHPDRCGGDPSRGRRRSRRTTTRARSHAFFNDERPEVLRRRGQRPRLDSDPRAAAFLALSAQRVGGGVPPGSGWPGDPATARTPVAHGADDVRRLAGAPDTLPVLEARESVCRACPRLVAWREEVAADQAGGVRRGGLLGPARLRAGATPPPGPRRRPRARRARRQPHRAGLHRRPLAATGCSPRCTGPGSPTSRRRRTPATGCGSPVRGSWRPSAARRRPTSRRRRSATPARPGSTASSSWSRPTLRVVRRARRVRLGRRAGRPRSRR